VVHVRDAGHSGHTPSFALWDRGRVFQRIGLANYGCSYTRALGRLLWALALPARECAERQLVTERDFDVVVVGAGIGGALVAYKLAQPGARVLILESGSRNPSRANMVGAYAVAAIKTPHKPYINPESDLKAPSPDAPNDYYDQSTQPLTQFKSYYERRTGGSTWHFLGHTPRMPRSVFRMESLYGGGTDFPSTFVDWPRSYDDDWNHHAMQKMVMP
jgi:hypothetical protein